ncbi:MAG: ATP-binding protein [Bacteroidales bacterium]|nr:ATP-binding protein [Bacteroidales bacterium]
MKFYNRTTEIEELHRIREKAFSSRSRMTIITGRRRIGKTSLALRATQGDEPTVYLFVSRKSEAGLCSEFTTLISEQLGVHTPEGLTSFRELFHFLMEMGKTLKFNLIIDEFQEFLNINPSVFSDMQNIWDTHRDTTNVNLLLMGSVYSMMHRIFENYHEPLFGRADSTLRLTGFGTDALKEIMSDFRPAYTNDELLALYTITGGVPKYVELLCEDTDLSLDGIFNYVVRENSPFVNEGRNLLIEEFGKDYGVYFSILSCIASGINTQGEIEATLGGTTVAGHLKRLIEDYSLIRRVRPIFAKERSQSVRYEIIDNFLKFWFNYFHRHQTIIEMRNFGALREIIKSDYPTFSGHALEKWFRLKMMESHEFVNLGGWWETGNNPYEIDIVGIYAEENHAVAAEVKRQRKNFKPELLHAKAEHLRTKALPDHTIDEQILTLEDM